jgi:hypothetical protein
VTAAKAIRTSDPIPVSDRAIAARAKMHTSRFNAEKVAQH